MPCPALSAGHGVTSALFSILRFGVPNCLASQLGDSTVLQSRSGGWHLSSRQTLVSAGCLKYGPLIDCNLPRTTASAAGPPLHVATDAQERLGLTMTAHAGGGQPPYCARTRVFAHTSGSKCTVSPSFRGTRCTLSRFHVVFAYLAGSLVGAGVQGRALEAFPLPSPPTLFYLAQ